MNYIQGDLIRMAMNREFDILVHGCNCFNTMGSGIAKQIKESFPGAYTVDQETVKGDYNKLGSFSYASYSPIIVNAYTQYDYGRDGVDRFNYLAFELILEKLNHIWPNKHYGMPYIGCGLAGGDQTRIVSMIQKFDFELSRHGGGVTLVSFVQ